MARVSRTRKRISTILLSLGIIGIGIWAWFIIKGDLAQRKANREFEKQLQKHARIAPPRPNAAPFVPRPGELIGRLVIPRLQLHAMIREGTDRSILAEGLGHVRGTAMPGAFGNVGIAGHRDTLFRCLRNISKDDVIVLQTVYGDYTYRVDATTVVTPKDVAVLAPTSHSEITLVTCYPFYYIGSAPDRFIVHARMTSEEAAGKNQIQESANPPAPASELLSSQRIRPLWRSRSR